MESFDEVFSFDVMLSARSCLESVFYAEWIPQGLNELCFSKSG